MAKAKKTKATETSATPEPSKSAPAPQAEAQANTGAPKPKKAPAKKAAKAQAAAKQPAGAPAAPLIDTNLAAQAAARMLVGKVQLGEDPLAQATQPQTPSTDQPAQPAHESSTFKHLKEQIAKPKPAALSHLLGGVGDTKKSGTHSILGQQRGHNQTVGHFNKTGVPRRTNG